METDLEATRGDTGENEHLSRLRFISYILSLIKGCQRLSGTGRKYHLRSRKQGPAWGDRETMMYRDGYPLYASFLGRHNEFQNYRRFRALRMRMLLLKQDKISRLEEDMNSIDQAEQSELFLGSVRRDRNIERKDVMARLDEAFSAYDDFLQRTHWAMDMRDPVPKHIHSMHNWLQSTGCIARPEIKYINAEPYDLLNIGQVKDQDMSKVANALQSIVAFVRTLKVKFRSKDLDTQETKVVIYKPTIRATARVLIAGLAVILLLVPVVVLNAVQQMLSKFIILFAAGTSFVTIIAVASEASLAEIFAAGAAYSAVLVVFISGNGVQAATQN